MYTNTISSNIQELLDKLSHLSFIKNFYLSGGTALALQLGHRESEDLDFFNKNDFNPESLLVELKTLGKVSDVSLDKYTLNCFINGVKLQLLFYPYKLLEKPVVWQNICLSTKLDIACTKLVTISARGSKKDFVDLYFLLAEYDLPFLLKKLDQKYADVNYNKLHILKSLIYFHDADNQPMPRMHKKADWNEIKKSIVEKVKLIKIA